MSKYKFIAKFEGYISAKNDEEALELAKAVTVDNLQSSAPEELLTFEIEKELTYSPNYDPMLDNDRKIGKAKAFINEIVEVYKKYNMSLDVISDHGELIGPVSIKEEDVQERKRGYLINLRVNNITL